MKKELTLLDDQAIASENCEHNFTLKANIKVDDIIYDIYYCSGCLLHVKKERPCPYNLEEI